MYATSEVVPFGKILIIPSFGPYPELYTGQEDQIRILIDTSPKEMIWISVDDVFKDWDFYKETFDRIIHSYILMKVNEERNAN